MEFMGEPAPDPQEFRQHICTISIGPVTGIAVVRDDDPRHAGEAARWSAARKRAQALHSADELLAGLSDQDWRARHECTARLIARAPEDPRTLPALIKAAGSDEAWQVRDAIVMGLCQFDLRSVHAVLLRATADPHPEVRWSAAFSLRQLGAQ
jgi:HEAT repeat protein